LIGARCGYGERVEELRPEVTRDIYGMPAFVTLTVADLDRTVDWYVNGLDFIALFTMPGPDGRPGLVHLRRWRYQDILVRPGQPGDGEWTVSVMALAEQLEAIAERARAHGGGRVEGPLDTPWNTRDLRTTDPDGYTLVYTARRPEGERDERFSAMIQEEARRQLGS
jgi:catechol 2,3-dioxygenase-like lactoylglutathione lyase family enzyme